MTEQSSSPDEIRLRWENTGQGWSDIPGQNYHTDMPEMFRLLDAERARNAALTSALQTVIFILNEMKASGSWDAPTLDRAIDNICPSVRAALASSGSPESGMEATNGER